MMRGNFSMLPELIIGASFIMLIIAMVGAALDHSDKVEWWQAPMFMGSIWVLFLVVFLMIKKTSIPSSTDGGKK